MRNKSEQDLLRERIGIRYQVNRYDTPTLRACRFKVSAKTPKRDAQFSIESQNPLSYKRLCPFRRNG